MSLFRRSLTPFKSHGEPIPGPPYLVDTVLPDGTLTKIELLAPTVTEHNRIADQTNEILARVNEAEHEEENPLTRDEIDYVLSMLPEGSTYTCDPEHGWGFYEPRDLG